MNRRGSTESITCSQDNCFCSLQPAQVETWGCKTLKTVTCFIITCLIAMTVSHFCDKYSSNNSLVVIRSEVGNLRSYLQTLSMEVQNTMEIRDELKVKLKEVGTALPKMTEAISKLRSEVSEELDLHTKTLLKALSMESIQDLVRHELETFNADKTGRTDYALENSGGSILTVRDTLPYSAGEPTLTLFGIPLCQQQNTPRAIIQSGVLPGECWAFKGQKGIAVIKLLGKIYVTGVSLEHISTSISPTGDTSSAPKDFSVWGLDDVNDKKGYLFGEFTYNNKGPSVQYFETKEKARQSYEIIELKIESNHGNPDYTCVYRIRVHGFLRQSTLI